MAEVFLKIVNMRISASYIVLAVLLLRLLLKRAPKWISVLLWGIVGFRLICPFSIEAAFSLMPSVQTVSPEIMTDMTPQINTDIPSVNQVINPVMLPRRQRVQILCRVGSRSLEHCGAEEWRRF